MASEVTKGTQAKATWPKPTSSNNWKQATAHGPVTATSAKPTVVNTASPVAPLLSEKAIPAAPPVVNKEKATGSKATRPWSKEQHKQKQVVVRGGLMT